MDQRETAGDFIGGGSDALGVGGELVTPAAIKSGNLTEITKAARQYLEIGAAPAAAPSRRLLLEVADNSSCCVLPVQSSHIIGIRVHVAREHCNSRLWRYRRCVRA